MDGIIIVGHGRMGKEIEHHATKMGIQVCAVANSYEQLVEMRMPGSCVALEFTTGESSTVNLRYLLEQNIPVVCGSTPWGEEQKNLAKNLSKEQYLMFSNNYSIGINIFWRIVRHTAQLMNTFDQYDLAIYEQHHNQKIDSPSGTAVHTAEIILQEVQRKTKMLFGNPHDQNGGHRPIADEELQVSSQRLGHIAGKHEFFCYSPEDSITIAHSAQGRAGLARGAIVAAQFLHRQCLNRSPGFFDMEDLMNYFLQQR